jgi:hypothetical protein
MFKKLNVKWMLILFSILLVLVLLTQFIKNRGSESNFNNKPVDVDTSKINAIYIKQKLATDEIKIVKTGSQWSISFKGKNMKPDQQAIGAILNELANIKVERIAATDKSEWVNYEVTDSASIKVRVEQEGKIVADFIVGKFSYQQNPQKFTTYIRVNGEDEVYATQGFLSMTFGRNVSDYRDKTIVNINPSNISRVTFTYPADSSFILEKAMNVWKIGDVVADSAKTASFINTLAHLNSYEILPEPAPQGKELFSVKIEGNSFQPVQLKAFESDTLTKYVITSTMNPDVQFNGGRGEVFKQIFAYRKNLMPGVKKK